MRRTLATRLKRARPSEWRCPATAWGVVVSGVMASAIVCHQLTNDLEVVRVVDDLLRALRRRFEVVQGPLEILDRDVILPLPDPAHVHLVVRHHPQEPSRSPM